MTRPTHTLIILLTVLVIMGMTIWVAFYTSRHPGAGSYRGHRVLPPPPHDYTPATSASTEEAAMYKTFVENDKHMGMLRSLSVDGNKVVFTVGPYWNMIPHTTQDMESYVETALGWGRITTCGVRDVDFVDDVGNVIAT